MSKQIQAHKLAMSVVVEGQPAFALLLCFLPEAGTSLNRLNPAAPGRFSPHRETKGSSQSLPMFLGAYLGVEEA